MFPSSLGNSYMVRCLRKHGSQTVFVSRKDVKVKDRDRIDNLDRTSDAQTGSDCHSSSDATRQTMYPKIMFVLGHVAGLALVTYILQHHTLGHPFLLADNRYTTARATWQAHEHSNVTYLELELLFRLVQLLITRICFDCTPSYLCFFYFLSGVFSLGYGWCVICSHMSHSPS